MHMHMYMYKVLFMSSYGRGNKNLHIRRSNTTPHIKSNTQLNPTVVFCWTHLSPQLLSYAPSTYAPYTSWGWVRTRNARETAYVERPLWKVCALPSGIQSAVPEACAWGSSSSHETAAYGLSSVGHEAAAYGPPPVQD